MLNNPPLNSQFFAAGQLFDKNFLKVVTKRRFECTGI